MTGLSDRTALLRRWLLVMFACLPLLGTSGCSVVKAAKQPNKKDLGVLGPGTPRSHVVAELGAPVWTKEYAEGGCDVFTFRQGYSKGNKVARVLFHGAADVATGGLWEVVGVPIEMIADGTEVKLEVYYDLEDSVDHVNVIAGEKAFENRGIFARRSSAPIAGMTTRAAPARQVAAAGPTERPSAQRPSTPARTASFERVQGTARETAARPNAAGPYPTSLR